MDADHRRGRARADPRRVVGDDLVVAWERWQAAPGATDAAHRLEDMVQETAARLGISGAGTGWDARPVPRAPAPIRRATPDIRSALDAHRAAWGDYADAIGRHECVLGRPAPDPVDGRGRLSARFVEWVMMLPDGWVTDHLTSRNAALHCLGNGVVPAQAAHAIRGLLARFDEA